MKKLSEKISVQLALLSMALLQFCCCQISATTCIEKERQALLRLKKSFEDPSNRLSSWNGTDCCNWNGVSCNQITGRVIKIDLRNSEVYSLDNVALFSNSIDSSLLDLEYLNYLDLSGNDFNYTQIPNFLGSMLELRHLDLSLASFYGKVPIHLGNLTKLVFLDLSTTDGFGNGRFELLNGGDGEWISGLSSLQVLNLSGMSFPMASNLMEVLSSVPLLSSLRLSHCSLENSHLSLGYLNSSVLTRIRLLDFSSNNLTGPINPETFHNITTLRFLDLSGNKFTSIKGGLLSFIGNNCGLKELYLSGNLDLGGDVFGGYENESMNCNRYDLQVLDLGSVPIKNRIPNWLGKLNNLHDLNLGYCYIYGSIPASLGNLSNLETLSLGGNDLSGAVPNTFGRLLNLRSLSIGYNRLEEMGVESFSQLRNLESLDISSNRFKGIITEAHFTYLSKLDSLMMGGNDFLFDINPNWVPPFQLTFLSASSCNCFGSKFPQWLQTQMKLRNLQLDNTNISSPLPTWLSGQNLTHLVLFGNQIVGPLPLNMGDQMPNLIEVYLHDNQINGSLPSSICKLKNLRVLDLSNNSLSGIVHGCFLTSNMLSLDLSYNKFSGAFPYSEGNLSNVVQLYLKNNNFEGSMPIVLKDSKILLYLDMEGNNFSGNIPAWVGYHLTDLRFLNLRGNMFNGIIPSSLCLLPYLQILDLAHNQIRGNIPSTLNDYSVMAGKIESAFMSCNAPGCTFIGKNVQQYLKSRKMDYSFSQIELVVNIDLSNNSLVGFIPKEITTLKKLIGLNLSHNNLVGTIPVEMGAIESLQSLDLSFNQLSGQIPTSMSKLNSLGVLELSHNNLSGEIPREGHLSTFNEASSFENNSFLCGDPLPVKCVTEKPFEPPHESEDLDEEDKWEKWLLYIMIMLGFVTGFLTVVGVLILNKSWRDAYFKFGEEATFKICIIMWQDIEKLKGICIPK